MTKEIKFEVVALEREDTAKKAIYGSSGLMLDKKFVITTGNILFPLFDDDFIKRLHSKKPGFLHTDLHLPQKINLKVFWRHKNNSKKYFFENGDILGMFTSGNVQLTPRQTLEGWAVDESDNCRELSKMLSVFVVFKMDTSKNQSDFNLCLYSWWEVIRNLEIGQCDEIFVRSVPFGNKALLNSYSRGIVSNKIGYNSCLIVSDCPVTPGSEGSPVYKVDSMDVPFGIVLSSSSWWRGDWTGLTLILDFRSILDELLYYRDLNFQRHLTKSSLNHLKAALETSFIQVYCGLNWGTAIIINAKDGILLTNSHVVNTRDQIIVWWKGKMDLASIIYKVPDGDVFDLAILKCSPKFLSSNNLKSIIFSGRNPVIGEEVYSIGFSIFSKEINTTPNISKGCVIKHTDSILLTTCCVNPGMSGGAIVDKFGKLMGVLVSNTKIEQNVYPRFNMAIPFLVIQATVENFLKKHDSTVLSQLSTRNTKHISAWMAFEAKL